LEKLKLSTLITEKEIAERVKVMGDALTDKFRNKDLVAVCILKGSFVFFSDLIRAINIDLSCEFLGVSSYNGGTKSSGEVKMTLDLTTPVEGKHVLLIEDIVDTGLTMNYLVKNIEQRKPKSITTASMLFKPAALKVDLKVDHVGFEIKDQFVVGYGLDYQSFYRNLPFIAQVENIN
jgi:hypoxanthine phosphoribosyltransferase